MEKAVKEERQMERIVKKNDMHARNAYQLKRLTDENFNFVPCSIEDTQDEIHFFYNMIELRPFLETKKSENSVKYGFLVQILEAVIRNPQFVFSLNSENLYIDLQNRIRIMERDYASDHGRDSDCLSDFLALAGCYFQKKYTYEDYRNGGTELLRCSRKTKFLLDIRSLEEAVSVCKERQMQESKKERSELITINRSGYYTKLIALCLFIITGVGLTALLVYQTMWLYYPQKRALMAHRTYMENNLTLVADALRSTPVEQMDNHEKYLLAAVYIRGQSIDSFDLETKERLISRLSYNGDSNRMDYWIHLGRMDVDKALDAAMRISDDQLLLYAYLQKLEQVSSDTALEGEDKAQQMELLKNKIKGLADMLGIEYKGNQAEGEDIK